jgi:type I restriction enzyme R subunit
VAFFHVLEKEMRESAAGMGDIVRPSSEAAERLFEIIERHCVVNWVQREDIQNDMRNDIDDFLFDVVRDEMGVPLTVEEIDRIVDRVLGIARIRMAT